MKLLRIFPRKTNATPNDDNVIINRLPALFVCQDLGFMRGFSDCIFTGT